MNLEIKIEKSAFGGDGIGYEDGKTCFVEGALPGEVVIAKVLQDKKNFIKAKIVKVVEASPFRLSPPCPYYETCGGCQYQHVTYEEELRIKESQVREMMQRALGAAEQVFKPIRYSGRDYGYRNSVTLHRTQKDNSKPQSLGFVGRDNETVVPIKNCLLVDPRFSQVFQLKFRLKTGLDKIAFKLSDKGQVVTDREEVFVRMKLGGEEFLASSKGFFQNNLPVTELLAQKVCEWVERVKPQSFFDLYSGVGTFSFLSAKGVPKIICVEESTAALQALRMNASEKGSKQIQIIQGRAEKTFPHIFSQENNAGTMVCLDPPRQGIEKELAEFFSKSEGIESIAYVSCDPATLTRDLKIILNEGRYQIEEVIPFDMFPRTKHVETAVLLINKVR